MHKFILELFWLFASHLFGQNIVTTKLQLENLKLRFKENREDSFDDLTRPIKDLAFFYIRNYDVINPPNDRRLAV